MDTQETDQVFRFVVGLLGAGYTCIEVWMTEEEFLLCDREDLPVASSWEHITVQSQEDAMLWMAAMNAYLTASWTPNQGGEEREENKIIRQEALAEMKNLEIY